MVRGLGSRPQARLGARQSFLSPQISPELSCSGDAGARPDPLHPRRGLSRDPHVKKSASFSQSSVGAPGAGREPPVGQWDPEKAQLLHPATPAPTPEIPASQTCTVALETAHLCQKLVSAVLGTRTEWPAEAVADARPGACPQANCSFVPGTDGLGSWVPPTRPTALAKSDPRQLQASEIVKPGCPHAALVSPFPACSHVSTLASPTAIPEPGPQQDRRAAASAKGALSSETRLPALGPAASGFTTRASPWVSLGPQAAGTAQGRNEEEEKRGPRGQSSKVQRSELATAGSAEHRPHRGFVTVLGPPQGTPELEAQTDKAWHTEHSRQGLGLLRTPGWEV